MRSRIVGTGSAVPDRILTNHDLEKMVDTSDEWITTRTGIKERRIASADEFTSTLATRAAKNALQMAGVSPADLDMIIVATVTPDYPFPSTATLLQNNLGATNASAFDVSAACSGFIYALSIVDKFIRTGTIKTALVVGAEVLSRIVDWNDRNSCLLFGDGAGAAVIRGEESVSGILDTYMKSDGSHWDLLYQPAPGSRNPVSQTVIDERLTFIRMQGNEVFKLAVRAMEEAALKVLSAGNMTAADVDLFIPHQANRRIIDAIGKRLEVPDEKVYVNIDRFGNTSSASIPIALDEANRKGVLQPGNLLLLDAFGGGLAWGAVTVRW
ncbi:MAG: ketoacyl-ACP synthase III [Geobacteraceae bacterium]|nr:ketoacyl-ACP synthase III [Geobacteraceae bacterium]